MTSPLYAALAAQIAGVKDDLEAVAEGTSDRLRLIEEALKDFAERPPGGPAAIAWWDLPEEDRLAEGDALAEWLETFLRVWFPSYTKHLPECVLAHNEALVELSNMRGEMIRIYSAKKPSLGDALVLYDRFFPSIVKRLEQVTQSCRGGICETATSSRGGFPAPIMS